MSRIVVLALLAALSAPAQAAPAKRAVPAKPVSQAVTCSLPVGPKDTFATVRQRFGAAAVRDKIAGAEGEELDGIVLWPADPARRLELILTDDQAHTVSSVRIIGQSRWTAGGLRLGDGLARVQQVNGKPFKLYGFGWDYGGYVNELAGGKLDSLPGGCNLSIRFEPSPMDDYPNGISGEVTLASSDTRLRAARPVVAELSVGW